MNPRDDLLINMAEHSCLYLNSCDNKQREDEAITYMYSFFNFLTFYPYCLHADRSVVEDMLYVNHYDNTDKTRLSVKLTLSSFVP